MTNEKTDKQTGNGKLLAMDTSSSSMSVALLEGGHVRKEITSYAERNHSIYLIPFIREAMAELGWNDKELQGIAVGRGPGSYTGVRIGVTVAKTMAWTLGLPVAGVSSLEAMAAGAFEASEAVESNPVEAGSGAGAAKGLATGAANLWLVPMMNARRGQVFTALFRLKRDAAAEGEHDLGLAPVSDPGWVRLQEDGIRLLERWADELLELIRSSEDPPATVLFAGETELFAPVLDRFGSAAWEHSEVRTTVLPYGIEARYIGYLGALRFNSGDTDDVHGLLPNYTQLAEAEVNLLGKK